MSPFRRTSLALAVAAAVALSSCGGYARKGSEQGAPKSTGEVGGGVDTIAPQVTEAPTTAPPTTARAADAPEEVKGPRGPANQTTRTDPSGFRVVLTLDGRLRYSASANLKMQLDVDNVSKQELKYDSNQVTYFQITPAGSNNVLWRNDQCDERDESGFRSPPVGLAPGESITLNLATYPGTRSNRESCRVLKPGQYRLIGYVLWCTEAAIENGICNQSKATTVTSAPIPFVID